MSSELKLNDMDTESTDASCMECACSSRGTNAGWKAIGAAFRRLQQSRRDTERKIEALLSFPEPGIAVPAEDAAMDTSGSGRQEAEPQRVPGKDDKEWFPILALDTDKTAVSSISAVREVPAPTQPARVIQISPRDDTTPDVNIRSEKSDSGKRWVTINGTQYFTPAESCLRQYKDIKPIVITPRYDIGPAALGIASPGHGETLHDIKQECLLSLRDTICREENLAPGMICVNDVAGYIHDHQTRYPWLPQQDPGPLNELGIKSLDEIKKEVINDAGNQPGSVHQFSLAEPVLKPCCDKEDLFCECTEQPQAPGTFENAAPGKGPRVLTDREFLDQFPSGCRTNPPSSIRDDDNHGDGYVDPITGRFCDAETYQRIIKDKRRTRKENVPQILVSQQLSLPEPEVTSRYREQNLYISKVKGDSDSAGNARQKRERPRLRKKIDTRDRTLRKDNSSDRRRSLKRKQAAGLMRCTVAKITTTIGNRKVTKPFDRRDKDSHETGGHNKDAVPVAAIHNKNNGISATITSKDDHSDVTGTGFKKVTTAPQPEKNDLSPVRKPSSARPTFPSSPRLYSNDAGGEKHAASQTDDIVLNEEMMTDVRRQLNSVDGTRVSLGIDTDAGLCPPEFPAPCIQNILVDIQKIRNLTSNNTTAEHGEGPLGQAAVRPIGAQLPDVHTAYSSFDSDVSFAFSNVSYPFHVGPPFSYGQREPGLSDDEEPPATRRRKRVPTNSDAWFEENCSFSCICDELEMYPDIPKRRKESATQTDSSVPMLDVGIHGGLNNRLTLRIEADNTLCPLEFPGACIEDIAVNVRGVRRMMEDTSKVQMTARGRGDRQSGHPGMERSREQRAMPPYSRKRRLVGQLDSDTTASKKSR